MKRPPYIRIATQVIAVSSQLLLCAQAMEIQRAESRYENGVYRFEMNATLDARVEDVQAVLRNYRNYPQLDHRILEARELERPAPAVVILYTRLRACFGLICRNVQRVERVEERPHELLATSVPERSDVKSGSTHTQLASSGERTEVTYNTQIVPDFWIPPLVGRRLMLRTLREATTALFTEVEVHAKARGSATASSPPAGAH
jgi:hypothetical protein